MPILQDTTTGEVTPDSLAIMKHLDSTYPNPSLLPSSVADRDIVEHWLGHINNILIPSFFRLMQAQPSSVEQHTTALAEFTAGLALISEQRTGPFFFGKDISLVDIAIAPWSVRDFIVKEFRGFWRQSVPRWEEWAEVLEARESVRRTTSVSFSASNIIYVVEQWNRLRSVR